MIQYVSCNIYQSRLSQGPSLCVVPPLPKYHNWSLALKAFTSFSRAMLCPAPNPKPRCPRCLCLRSRQQLRGYIRCKQSAHLGGAGINMYQQLVNKKMVPTRPQKLWNRCKVESVLDESEAETLVCSTHDGNLRVTKILRQKIQGICAVFGSLATWIEVGPPVLIVKPDILRHL